METALLPWKPCDVGDDLDSVQTPALILDLDAFERNLDHLMASAKGLRVRPHAKSHKCPEIAHRQMARGAVGICCQKLSEAFVFAQAGIRDILLTNQVVGAAKLARLADLSQSIRLGVLVDNSEHVKALADAMMGKTQLLDVYIEIEVGGNRCGVQPNTALELAHQIVKTRTLRFAGLHCYHGPAQHFRQESQRHEAIASASDIAGQSAELLRHAGIEVPCITGAGTGTFWLERDSGVYTEIQPGSYAFMDRDYADNLAGPGDVRFEHALFIHTTVMSDSHEGFVVVDAGLKSMSVDSGMPRVHELPGLVYLRASDEHGVVDTTKGKRPSLGQTLRLIPGHCDPTVNLYDDLVVIRERKVVDIWPISARGASL
ncbi:MAG: DSD1 family PLP-dependent enzyme [Burkholderiaceae bacterium]|nr:DSD1 family PLP-dependent enzyme [Burkholderiaceae bacterium]MCD8516325.1 DSD1 family PLP-dependent enzyme [Burkholderiaceae bacterium]MCD8538275.1 DSD1 family PLP-dependent enzyme [Burkholderiaceae bacterium]